ncbi:YgaB family protein [Jeotgalibacillus haloalkalitolerans]|uniref:YgaB family protein n=1 Tax=Jeotgalibacillus haloalkalitolerans TaxID=3104292 RepID=A0ABU5KRE1_9BACL|nr:YgaB family protein [Jeotgalibacillus sp. HH7-29]MDZ5713371.1 YgaB family protein [Jeotgalibacillus sp. HH7-29]
MNAFKEKVYQQMETAKELLHLYAELEKKKKMRDFLMKMEIHDSAEQLHVQLQELDCRLKDVQEMFDQQMNEVVNTPAE